MAFYSHADERAFCMYLRIFVAEKLLDKSTSPFYRRDHRSRLPDLVEEFASELALWAAGREVQRELGPQIVWQPGLQDGRANDRDVFGWGVLGPIAVHIGIHISLDYHRLPSHSTMSAVRPRGVLLIANQDDSVGEIEFVAHPLHCIHTKAQEVGIQPSVNAIGAKVAEQIVHPLLVVWATACVADQDSGRDLAER
jgi:hypothetical protein